MEQLAKSRPSLLRGGIPGYHLELGCKIVDEGDRVSTGLGRYRRCECSGERDHGCGQKGTSQHGRLRGSVWWVNDRTVCAANLLAEIRQIPGGSSIRGRSRPSTALDPERAAQVDPYRPELTNGAFFVA